MALNLNRQKSQKSNVMIPDDISHLSGTISVRFGTKTYTLVLSTLSSNTRYQIYLVPGGTLVSSTNENSVGPAGYTSWILVGSFYSTSQTVPVFGSFIRDLFGVPETEEYAWVPTVSGLGSGSGTLVYSRMKRIGPEVLLRLRYDKDATSGTGSALVTFTQPSNVQFNGISTPYVGVGESSISTNGWNIAVNSIDNIYFYNGGSFLLGSSFVSGRNLIGVITYPVFGWSNTPIAYL